MSAPSRRFAVRLLRCASKAAARNTPCSAPAAAASSTQSTVSPVMLLALRWYQLRRRGPGQHEGKRRAHPELTRRTQLPSHRARELAADGKTEPRALRRAIERLINAHERIEYTLEL